MIYTEPLIETIRQTLAACLDYWSLPGNGRVELLTVSENLTYRVDSVKGEPLGVLRLHRPHYHERAEIESELAWIEALRDSHAVNTPAILAGAAGPILSIRVLQQTFSVVAFEFLPGQEPDVGARLPDWFEHLGAVTASLHQHSRQWPRPAGFVRKEWNLNTMLAADGHWGDWRAAEGLNGEREAMIAAAIKRIRTRIEEYGHSPERFGLVHADLRLANLLVDGEQLRVIDFDDCGISWYAYDFAAAISFHELDPAVPRLRQAWVRGYRRHAAFSEMDEAMLDTFIMIRRIMLTAWLANHVESDTYRLYGAGYAAGTAWLAQHYLGVEQEVMHG